MRHIGSVRDIAIKYAVVFVLAVVLGLVLRWCSNPARGQAPPIGLALHTSAHAKGYLPPEEILRLFFPSWI